MGLDFSFGFVLRKTLPHGGSLFESNSRPLKTPHLVTFDPWSIWNQIVPLHLNTFVDTQLAMLVFHHLKCDFHEFQSSIARFLIQICYQFSWHHLLLIDNKFYTRQIIIAENKKYIHIYKQFIVRHNVFYWN